jgi:hypothetical protein
MATHDPAALLRAKAGTYRDDALKMSTDPKLRAGLGEAEADYWARNHREVADVLDRLAGTLAEAAPVPVAAVTNAELALVLKGGELTFITDQGGLVKVRLIKVDELIASQKESAEKTGYDPGMTREQAEALCRPIPPGVL